MIYVYAGRWPYERIAWLRNPKDLTYSFELMGYGQFQFTLPKNDAQGIVVRDLVGITTDDVANFMGIIERTQESTDDATVRVDGRSIESVLSERIVAQERVYPSTAGGDIARDMLRRVNGRNQTGIRILSTGPSLPLHSPYASRSDSVLTGLADLVNLTGWEWEVTAEVGITVAASFTWVQRVGFDIQHQVHLAGKMIAGAGLDVDVLSERQIIQLVGASGTYGDRPSAVAAIDAPLALQDMATVRLPVNPAPSRKQRRRPGIATSRETAVLEAFLPDAISVQKQLYQLILTGSAETLSLTVNRNADWSMLRVGNIVTVRLANFQFGDHLVRPFRIHGLQVHPDGKLGLLGKVLPNAA